MNVQKLAVGCFFSPEGRRKVMGLFNLGSFIFIGGGGRGRGSWRAWSLPLGCGLVGVRIQHSDERC